MKNHKPSGPNSGRGRLQEWLFTRRSNCEALTGKILVFWIGGRLREVVAHRGSTVVTCALATSPLAFARIKIRRKKCLFSRLVLRKPAYVSHS